MRMVANSVPIKIFGSERDEVIGGWRKLPYKEKYHKFYFSSNIIRMIKSRRIRWAEHITIKHEKMRPAYKRLSENLKETDNLVDLVVYRILLKRNANKQNVGLWTPLNWLQIGSSAGSCEHSNGISRSIKTEIKLDDGIAAFR
jgi:hypothetical protein